MGKRDRASRPALISDLNNLRSSYAWLGAGLRIKMVHMFGRNPLEVSGFCLGDVATSATFLWQEEGSPFFDR